MIGHYKHDEYCDKILREDERRVLGTWATRKIPETATSVKQAVHLIRQMGGWRKRDAQDYPITTGIWRDWARMPTLA